MADPASNNDNPGRGDEKHQSGAPEVIDTAAAQQNEKPDAGHDLGISADNKGTTAPGINTAAAGDGDGDGTTTTFRKGAGGTSIMSDKKSLEKADIQEPQEWSSKLSNPLVGIPPDDLAAMGERYCRQHIGNDEADVRAFRLGAVIAADPAMYTGGNAATSDDDNNNNRSLYGGGPFFEQLTDKERSVLEREETHKWSNPRQLYALIIICSLSAAVQGMDETVVNGAQIFYKAAFGIGDDNSKRDSWLVGLCNSAPYLCCATMGCWVTEPLNRRFGRKGTVFFACVVSALACFWQAFTNTWYHMFIARFFLGFGIGPKSATMPVFAVECAPPKLRGALSMQWQMWVAFGIMMGYVADLAFYFVPDHGVGLGLNWRLMMGSAMIPAVIVILLIHTCVESPRWYLSKERHRDAYASFCELRFEKVQAARDLFYMHTLLEAEREVLVKGGGTSVVKEILTVPRNRNAMIASEIVMFMQQFCGVNVLAYYSSQIFLDANLSEVNALGASVGWGVINWLFAIPAIYTIDTFGRRNLLLVTFPLMALFMLFAGFSFWIPADSDARVACVALGMYLFGMVYSPGEGPVPFTYAAEAYPLYIRSYGMSLATATTWFFNFILSVTWPSLLLAFRPQGAFGWYAAWNMIGWVAVLFLMPETKEKTLEELDAVFSVPIKQRVAYGGAQFVYFLRRYVLCGGRSVEAPQEPIAEEYLREAQELQLTRERERDATARV
ncbi:Sugar/inositol transporter [Niveomyces insectorum RCEF 264]|uniref:Sugar/inositol transporter n=1 Tax=Niveomyces insectorum RCEF 264 TaxID=1081102 RepID=A0A167Z8C0_9HYPO|nr:Sugar/inositol transporter [Niveomyces insectorum RCEF 264]